MKLLISGGAGFIGSNLVESFLQDPQFELVRVLDNLATGSKSNIEAHLSNPKFQFIEGDIRNPGDCEKACEGIEVICHQAALGSVPRSIADPFTSHNVNVNGFINILESARKAGITRVVYASSSSVYGDLPDSPKVENRIGKVLSPYAATKMCNEVYAEAWAKTYGLQIIGLRYFNVFGPRQDPNGPYAAVIPLFIKSAIQGTPPLINGDGSITRDFTPVENVVQVNRKAILNPFEGAFHKVINVACGKTTSLLQLWNNIEEITGQKMEPIFGPVRKGDILQSLANIGEAQKLLGYIPFEDLKAALGNTYNWYRQNGKLLS